MQISTTPEVCAARSCYEEKWCPGAESNHRHCDFQSHALPTELPGRRGPPKGRAKQSARFIEAGFPPVQTSCWAVGKRSKLTFRGSSNRSAGRTLCIGALMLRSRDARSADGRLEARGRALRVRRPSFETRASHAPQDED